MSNNIACELYGSFNKTISPFENNQASPVSLIVPSTEAVLGRGRKVCAVFAKDLQSITKTLHKS